MVFSVSSFCSPKLPRGVVFLPHCSLLFTATVQVSTRRETFIRFIHTTFTVVVSVNLHKNDLKKVLNVFYVAINTLNSGPWFPAQLYTLSYPYSSCCSFSLFDWTVCLIQFDFTEPFIAFCIIVLLHLIMFFMLSCCKNNLPVWDNKGLIWSWIFLVVSKYLRFVSLQCPVEALPACRCRRRLRSAWWSAGYLRMLMSSSIVCLTLRWPELKARTALWVGCNRHLFSDFVLHPARK